MWPIFLEADCDDCIAEGHGLRTAYNLVRNGISEFFYSARNMFQLFYYSIRNEVFLKSSKVSSGATISLNLI